MDTPAQGRCPPAALFKSSVSAYSFLDLSISKENNKTKMESTPICLGITLLHPQCTRQTLHSLKWPFLGKSVFDFEPEPGAWRNSFAGFAGLRAMNTLAGVAPSVFRCKRVSPPIWLTSAAVQFSCSVVSSSLWPHGLQHTTPPRPSPTPRVYWNPCPLSRWCHPNILSSVIPISTCLQSFPASGSFPMSQLFASGGQRLELQLQHQSFPWIFRIDLFRIEWLDLLAVQGTLQQHSSKVSILWCSAFFMVQFSHP